MRIMVTGGLGFIGSAFVRHVLETTEVCVVNVDKCTYAASPESMEPWQGNERYVHVKADIADQEAMRACLSQWSPSCIVHLAAETHVDRSIDGAAPFIQTNIVGTYTLLDAAKEYWRNLTGAAQREFRFVHVSTDEVFGALGPADPAFDESTAYDPRSPYSASKAASDHLARAWWHTYGLPVIVTNTSNNYGPWQFPEKLIPLTILNALEGRPLPVYGDGSNVRDWIHVADHAAALMLALERGEPGGSYCIGAGQERSNLEVVKAICASLDRRFPAVDGPRERLITWVTDRPGHDFRYAINSARARQALGWAPSRTFEIGLEQTIQWYMDHRDWWQSIRAQRYDGQRLGIEAGQRTDG